MTGLIRSSANFAGRAGRTVSKGGKKITKATIPDELEFGIADRLDKGTRSLQRRGEQIRFSPKAPDPAEAAPVIPLPDEDALSLARRRQRSRRRGSRAATVLTGGDQETVG